ncbi:MAG: ABC transporter transmembrane domain-containing protein [Sulfuricella sp.]|nr:ABC transporter transmembrane domain-containing protein [Sulfuricella sp.]
MLGKEVRSEDCLWLLGSLCSLHRIPFDAALVASRFPPSYTLATFHEAARALGFKTGARPLPQAGWDKQPFPCIVFLRESEPATCSPSPSQGEGRGEGKNATLPTASPTDADIIPFPAHPEKLSASAPGRQATQSPSPAENILPLPPGEGRGEGNSGESPLPGLDQVTLNPILIVKSDGQNLLYFRPHSQTPETLGVEEAAARLEPELILLAREPAGEGGQPETIAGFETDKPQFGFRWFIPELLKHKIIWRDVVLASLAIQLVGLATPVFTQVIIDKVVVHQTHSTLIVIGIALAMFMLFTMAMTWLRQYLVLHTGNRIDAVLGSQVFRHLLRLPLSYFEQRPTGVLVARLHGVETIREFVSSAAVTLVLDFPFLHIFLAVMFAYSWQLSLIAVSLLGLIAVMSLLVAPVFRDKLNQQFMLGARNQGLSP